MSGTPRPVAVFFDLGQTLGFEVRRIGAAAGLEFQAYEGIAAVLQALRQQGVRCGVLTAGTRWTAGDVQAALASSSLAGYFEPGLVRHWAADSDAQFQALVSGLGGEALFVSANRRRRLLARRGGLRPLPHFALAPAAAAGGRLTYLRARGDRLPFARVGELCRAEPVAVPIRAVTIPDSMILYVVTTVAADPGGGARQRFEAAGLAVEEFADARRLETADLCVLRVEHLVPDASGDPLGSVRDSLVAEEEGGVVLVALEGRQSGDEIDLASCVASDAERQPELALLLPADEQSEYRDYALSDEERSVLASLDEPLYQRFLAPWWKELSTDPDGGIASRHVRHPDNARAVAVAAEMLAQICGTENVRLYPFDSPFGGTLDNVEAVLPADPTSPERDEIVVLGAHLDSLAKENTDHARDPAPGLDDDASGMAGVLSAARVLVDLARGRPPRRTVRFVLFNAEEIILHGSAKYVADRVATDKFVAMFQLDMIGYRASTEQRQCEVHTGIGRPFDDAERLVILREQSNALGALVARAASEVSPDIDVLLYPLESHCNDQGSSDSDHAPFFGEGIPACKVCEDFYFDTCSADRRPNHPTYHSRRDTVVDTQYASDISRAVACAVWMRANAT